MARRLWPGVLLLAIVVAVAAGLAQRDGTTYSAQETLLVTSGDPPPITGAGVALIQAEARRASAAAIGLAHLANRQMIRDLAERTGAFHGSYRSAPVRGGAVRITAYADKPEEAVRIATRISRTLIDYVRTQQAQALIPPRQRFNLQFIYAPRALRATASHASRPTCAQTGYGNSPFAPPSCGAESGH